MVHKQMEKEELYHLYNTINTASPFTNELQNYAFNFKQPFKFIDIYQSPDTTIDGLDWHSLLFFFFVMLWKITFYKPHVEKTKV